MDKQLLEYLRAMALELAALAEEGNFASLSQFFGMAALDAGQRLGPAIVFSQEAPQEMRQGTHQEMRQEGSKEAPADGPVAAGQRRSRPRRRRTDEPAGTRHFRRSRKHPLHAAT
jgi:hypothetical protein